jgi:predicted RNase H-like HicB family nuclease
MNLTAVYIKAEEGYVAFVRELPGANTQGETIEEARENLKDAIECIIEFNRESTAAEIEGQEAIVETIDA